MIDLLLNVLILFVVLLTAKRACVGPQKNFARTSGSLVAAGGIGLWLNLSNKESVAFNLSAIVLCTGITVLVLMIAADNWWMLKKLVAESRKDK